MRILDFIVEGQEIRKDVNCDFSGIVRGSKGYLKARFRFGDEWKGHKKVAIFEKLMKEHPAPIINGVCDIPSEALTWSTFKVSVLGERDGQIITTKKVEVQQS